LERLSSVYGGAAYISDNSSLSISNCTIRGNSAQWGAGFVCNNDSRLVVRQSLLQGLGSTTTKYGRRYCCV
jgi:hypothetical protein